MHLRTYQEAYAHHAPRYREYYADKSSRACCAARDDILDTMHVMAVNLRCGEGLMADPYTGKLYAELDAVRDRLMNLRSLSALRAKARRNPDRFNLTKEA